MLCHLFIRRVEIPVLCNKVLFQEMIKRLNQQIVLSRSVGILYTLSLEQMPKKINSKSN